MKSLRSPLGTALFYLLAGSAFFVFWKWDSLSSHARGMILAVLGVAVLRGGLNDVSRTRRLLKSGARTQGTVVGAERNTSREPMAVGTSTTYRRVVRFTTADGRVVEFTSAVGYSVDDAAVAR
jgi:hypothetical protein